MEDQEQQDPLDFLPSDEGEEEEPDDEKSGGGGTARRRLQEQRERLHGALALIELANNLSAWEIVEHIRLNIGFCKTPVFYGVFLSSSVVDVVVQ